MVKSQLLSQQTVVRKKWAMEGKWVHIPNCMHYALTTFSITDFKSSTQRSEILK